MEEIEVSEAYLEFLDELVSTKKAIKNRKEAIEYCVRREARLR